VAADEPGAYLLLVTLRTMLTVALPGRNAVALPAGRYLYCGSAYGPGGVRARLRRHIQRGKALRWHIDRLTQAGNVAGAWVVPDGGECALAAALSQLPAPVRGFGSSDCRRCRSHLLYWPADHSLDVFGVAGHEG